MQARRVGLRTERPLRLMPGSKATVISSLSVPMEALPAVSPAIRSTIMSRRGREMANGSIFPRAGRGIGIFGKYRPGVAVLYKLPRAVASAPRNLPMPSLSTCGYREGLFGKCGSRARSPSASSQACSCLSGGKITRDGIYFIDGSTIPARVRLLDLATQRVRTITSMDLGPGAPGAQYFDLSPDGQWILFDRLDQVESDIMVV